MNLLLIEDDLEAAKFLQKGLDESGYAVALAVDGRDGLRQAQEQAFDLLITDRMLPHLDGLALVRALREQGVRTPVLVLSALGTVDDRVLGLKAGGDDYLTKPFAFSELLARVEALLRRSAAEKNVPQTRIRVADLEMDLLSRSVRRAGKEIQLTAREFKLLEFLMRHAGPGGHAHHAAGGGLGPAVRSADQSHRRAHEPPAPGGRQGLRAAAHPYRARRRLCDPR